MRKVFQFSVVIFIFAVSCIAETDTSMMARRSRVAASLDSLEFEKQLCKRQGRPLDQLEDRCRTLRDSLDFYRASASGATFSPAETVSASNTAKTVVSPNKSGFSIGTFIEKLSVGLSPGWHTRIIGMMHPKSPFDWFILLVSAVAFISGLVLLFGIIGWLRERFSQTRHPKLTHRTQTALPPPKRTPAITPRSNLPPPPSDSPAAALDLLNRLKQSNLRTDPPATTTPHAAPTLKPPPAAVGNTEEDPGLFALRKRMRGEDVEPTEVAAPHSAVRPDMSVRELVISAHSRGESPHDIARRLHLSSDQVLLILRVAGLSS